MPFHLPAERGVLLPEQPLFFFVRPPLTAGKRERPKLNKALYGITTAAAVLVAERGIILRGIIYMMTLPAQSCSYSIFGSHTAG